MNGFTPRAYTNLHHRYTKPNTIAYFLRAYYVLLHGRLFFYALFVLLLRETNGAILFFSKRGVNFRCFFQQSNTEGKTKDLWEPWKLNIQHTGTLPVIRAVKWARQDLPKGKERETPTLCYLSADKKAMTLTGDNDTSVIRGRSIMKGRGWDSHGAACNSRLCCSLYIRGVEDK